MKCAKCGNELKDGRLYCEHCGEEIKIVPEFDLEFEKQIKETLDNLAKDVVSETEEPTQEDVFQKIDQEDIDFHDSFCCAFCSTEESGSIRNCIRFGRTSA